ncbi:formate dehydrogenase accessory sulfurtransferase FdhD [Sphingomonas cavernae]|uniref:Sulfur carrier protein FdhD n=1 Tax=Sphingomonas cavernae TaxID=2320861 RepID=A0A418WKL3_9SPHN|nr:formate dehydrogenase accessory sulfurtransferase FdhD [Sphingomonas cavernae]RJF90560.1 formate dehydrogenase accessory sulfurtransferase FdhD [Sphingomonas cavernae]
MTEGSNQTAFSATLAGGGASDVSRGVAIEAPVAIEFNGLGYAVMMATPAYLEDFAYGFALSERLIEGAVDILDVDMHDTGSGTILRVQLVEARAGLVVERVRHRVSESSCGLCGIENLEQALRPLPKVAGRTPDPQAVFAALGALGEHQPLSHATGAVHGAALCGADGTIRLVREDVGRHNAFDKLNGAMLRAGLGWDGGFALLTARCSYELVEKAALAGCPALVTISAPTSLALERAEAAGLVLLTLARPDSYLVVA